MLRSCYRTKFRFGTGSPTQTDDIIWYWAPEGARDLGIPTVFNSLNWYDRAEVGRTDTGALGEVPGERRFWRNGRLSDDPYPNGEVFCGPAAWFVEGTPPGQVLPRHANGIAEACIIPPPAGEGLGLTGESFVRFFDPGTPSPCLGGPETMPLYQSVQVQDMPIVEGTDLNGAWVVQRCIPSGIDRGYLGFRPRALGGFWAITAAIGCTVNGPYLRPYPGTTAVDLGDGRTKYSPVNLGFSLTSACTASISFTGNTGAATVPSPP